VYAADSLIGNDKIAVLGFPAKHNRRLIEWQPLTRRSTFEYQKRGHEIPPAKSALDNVIVWFDSTGCERCLQGIARSKPIP
jgi:hypothetical protein